MDNLHRLTAGVPVVDYIGWQNFTTICDVVS